MSAQATPNHEPIDGPAAYLRAYLDETGLTVRSVAASSRGTYIVEAVTGTDEVPGPRPDENAVLWAMQMADRTAKRFGRMPRRQTE